MSTIDDGIATTYEEFHSLLTRTRKPHPIESSIFRHSLLVADVLTGMLEESQQRYGIPYTVFFYTLVLPYIRIRSDILMMLKGFILLVNHADEEDIALWLRQHRTARDFLVEKKAQLDDTYTSHGIEFFPRLSVVK